MAVGAFDGVDVVGALGILERCVHGLDVDAAVGELGMARCAGGARSLTVLLVAGEAAQTLVDSDGRSIVS